MPFFKNTVYFNKYMQFRRHLKHGSVQQPEGNLRLQADSVFTH